MMSAGQVESITYTTAGCLVRLSLSDIDTRYYKTNRVIISYHLLELSYQLLRCHLVTCHVGNESNTLTDDTNAENDS